MTNQCHNLSVSIARSAEQAYDFLSVPENFPRWASGLAGSLRRVDGAWGAETPHGPVKGRFSERNAFGGADHWLSAQPGVEVYIPMGVIANGGGCRPVFSPLPL